ncbi:guanylate kinase [Apiospora saccharicola]|uniref:Guanylate kinase n=1 Tax=Apiospora saccharicola TaxID=335842 RepID=A0ABR1WJF4_9PEZI
MSSLDIGVPQAAAFSQVLQTALEHAREIKTSNTIEPALSRADFNDLFAQLPTIFPLDDAEDGSAPENKAPDGKTVDPRKKRQYDVVEVVARNQFNTLVASISVEQPEFVDMWNLLDIVTALTDNENCDPALTLSLVESLLDSQTIKDCRITFDYLESRRERLNAVPKHSSSKKLVMLRFCNELLRRLSRAEDIAFCGRVFIFLFQGSPLGDKSGVNLRGEYHTENVTTYEKIPPKTDGATDKMDVDSEPTKDDKDGKGNGPKAVSFDSRNRISSEKEKPLDMDTLYPIFWSLQEYFSQPTKLFDTQNFAKFKSALEATIVAFESVTQGQKGLKATDDTKDASKKRKRIEANSIDNSNFNPKYLTSRDLFELEISDLFFRRHILIQAVIVLDFLRSLTASARTKYANISNPNRSVMYSDKIVSEDDDKWADSIKRRINDYILSGPDGQYVHRIIQSVTSRDKGWTRWKMEGCPPISRKPVTPEEFNEARAAAKRMATSKRLRPHPMGSLNLEFLKEEDGETAMAKFKDPARYQLPDLAVFQAKIADDDLNLDFAKSDKERADIMESKASKTWRALRLARRSRLAALDKIDDWQNIDAVFEDPNAATEEPEEEEGEVGRKPDDKRLIIISGPSGAGKSALVSKLLERQPRVFKKLAVHTTRKPAEGEVNGDDFQFVESGPFNALLDGDKFFSFVTRDGADYGTSRGSVDAIGESGKTAIVQLDQEGVYSVKENLYDARVVFIAPPSSAEAFEARLKASGSYAEDKIPGLLKTAEEEVEQAKAGDSYEVVVVNDDLEEACKALEAFIYGDSSDPAPEVEMTNGVNGEEEAAAPEESAAAPEEHDQGQEQEQGEEDVAMKDNDDDTAAAPAAANADGGEEAQTNGAAPVEA